MSAVRPVSCLDFEQILDDLITARLRGLPDTAQRIQHRFHLAACPTCHAKSASLQRDRLAWSPWLAQLPLALTKLGRATPAAFLDANPGCSESYLAGALAQLDELKAAEIFAEAEQDPMCRTWIPALQRGLQPAPVAAAAAPPAGDAAKIEALSQEVRGLLTRLEEARSKRRPDWVQLSQLALLAACALLLLAGTFLPGPGPGPSPTPGRTPSSVGVHGSVPVGAWRRLSQVAADAARQESDPVRKSELEGLARFAAERSLDPLATVEEWLEPDQKEQLPEELIRVLEEIKGRLEEGD